MRTDDLFLAAFALARGAELAGIDVSGVNGRRIAFFRIEGPGLVEAEREYFHGPAVVHLQLLKAAVRRLKDAAFGAIREEERRSHAFEDQPRSDRRHQVAGRPGPGRR
jgi:hypothetical protein